MINTSCLHTIYWIVAIVVILLYTIFAPEMFFHNTRTSEKPKRFDRWTDKRLAWNIHQSFIHMMGSLTGFLCLDILLFQLGINDPSKYSVAHLVLFLVGIAGIMGFIPRILFESKVSK